MEKVFATHGFPPVIDAFSEILILGSFPSLVSRKHSFFYMHPQNRFWQVLSEVSQEDFTTGDVETRKRLLAKHHLALYDVVESCFVEGSSDASLADVTPADIPALVKTGNIGKIILNGKTACKLFFRFFPEYAAIAECLPSTSSANAGYSLKKLVSAWKIIS